MPRKSHPQEKKHRQQHPAGWYPAGPVQYPPGFHGHPRSTQHHHKHPQPIHPDMLMSGMMDTGKMAVGGMVMVGTIGAIGSIIKPPGSP